MKSNNNNKRRIGRAKVGITAVVAAACIATASVGFASWVISAKKTSDSDSGNVRVDTVSTNYVAFEANLDSTNNSFAICEEADTDTNKQHLVEYKASTGDNDVKQKDFSVTVNFNAVWGAEWWQANSSKFKGITLSIAIYGPTSDTDATLDESINLNKVIAQGNKFDVNGSTDGKVRSDDDAAKTYYIRLASTSISKDKLTGRATSETDKFSTGFTSEDSGITISIEWGDFFGNTSNDTGTSNKSPIAYYDDQWLSHLNGDKKSGDEGYKSSLSEADVNSVEAALAAATAGEELDYMHNQLDDKTFVLTANLDLTGTASA